MRPFFRYSVGPYGSAGLPPEDAGLVSLGLLPFANRDEQKTGRFREWQRGYVMLILSNTMDLKRFLSAQ